jgi:hypothetical protein
MGPEHLGTSRHVSEVIGCGPDLVYEFAADPANLPRWAAGLASSPVSIDGDRFVVDSPMGRVTVRFAPHNEFGVLDHDVTLPTGETVHNPMRVLSHPRGSEVVFTVRQLDRSEAEFSQDVDAVAEDLARLRVLMEADA